MQILNVPTHETLLWQQTQQQEWKIFIPKDKYRPL